MGNGIQNLCRELEGCHNCDVTLTGLRLHVTSSPEYRAIRRSNRIVIRPRNLNLHPPMQWPGGFRGRVGQRRRKVLRTQSEPHFVSISAGETVCC
jgi:hypothetical protein